VTAPVFAILAGGGTGGHTYPALALAQELVARGHPGESIRFVGARRGPEGRIVSEAGFAIELLPGRGLQRRFTFENLGVILQTVAALARAVRIVRRDRPRVVVGFGGYASLPCVLAATLWRVPRIVHEQDAVMGLANRIAVRFGAQAAASLPGVDAPGVVLTGNPVRAEFRSLTRAPQHPPLVAVYGGALGAGSINRAAVELYDLWRARTDVAVHHIAGERNVARVRDAFERVRRPGDALDYELVGYERHMDRLMARASVAVCRAGAGTIAELTAAGLPAVLVPLPGAPGDHQHRNARTLAEAGAAVVLSDEECDGAHLDSLLSGLVTRPDRLARMSQAATTLARVDAAARLADLVEARARA